MLIRRTTPERTRDRTNSPGIVLHLQPETTRAFGTRRAAARIVAKARRALAAPTTAPRITPASRRVRIIARRGQVQAQPPIPVAAARIRHHKQTRRPTIAATRRHLGPTRRRRAAPTLRQRLAVPIPHQPAPIRLLAAATAEVAERLMAVVVQPRTAVVVVVAADRTAIGRVSAFQKGPRLENDAGLLLFCFPSRAQRKGSPPQLSALIGVQ